MGFLGTIIKAPFRLLGKGKNLILPPDDSIPIEAVVKTKYPAPYEDYYQSQGFDTSSFRGYTIAWKEGTNEKKKEKILEELRKIV